MVTGRPRSEQGDAYRTRLLAFVQEYRREHGFAPKVTDLCAYLGITRTAVRHHLTTLRRDNFLTYLDAEIARTLTVTPKGVAHLRKVAADPVLTGSDG